MADMKPIRMISPDRRRWWRRAVVAGFAAGAAWIGGEPVTGPRYSPQTGRKLVERDYGVKDHWLMLVFQTPGGRERMWQRFPEMTADDQGIYAEEVAGSLRAGGLAEMRGLLAAEPQAKSDEVRETLRRSLNSLVFSLLDEPDLSGADQAETVAAGQRLRGKGTADELLLAKLRRRETGEAQGEGDRRVEAFLAAPSTSAMLGRVSWQGRAEGSRKQECASRLQELHDREAYARMWRLLPELSADDQVIFSEAIREPVDLEQALPMVRAARALPGTGARERMLRTARGLVKRALEDPERKARAQEIEAEIRAEGE